MRRNGSKVAAAVRTKAVPAVLGVSLIGSLSMLSADALVIPGTPNKDVTIGADNDNANNAFVQPRGARAKQHMEDTDVLFGRDNDDLLIGRAGSDTLVAGTGADILVGGPEKGRTPNSDVLLGEDGDDISVWAPGDGSEVFLGDQGYDTIILAPLVLDKSGTPALKTALQRKVPRVTTGRQPQFSCTIVNVPDRERLGVDHLVRFNVNGSLAVTVRLRGVERVICPSAKAGHATVADLTKHRPKFANVPVRSVTGVAGAIVAG